ncbi:MAG TPA: SCP2 sterol-binding domain-containing protein [Cellvibrionaceae bacterium]|nr:SCP2 sterol-binding domain-containing protein [Cellvibrionaceae bacterium]HNG58879.1 SCP2 sterol-binding domain-containing protein [Cellvibrionaceae bacterium]
MSLPLIGAGLRSALEAALNSALSLDPASQRRLEDLAGKSVQLEITDLRLNWCLHLNYPLLLLEAGAETAANSRLSGKLQDFVGLALKDSASLSHSGVSHAGDIQLLNTCIQLFKNLELDWAGVVSEHLGPLPGALVDQLYEACGTLKQTLAKLPPFLGDYVQNELQLVPSKPQLDLFTQDIHELRSRADRLTARIERLDARLDQERQKPHV